MALLDVVKFDSPSDEIIVYKFPSESLKLGAQLIVNQGQEALFVKGGQALDLFGPGTYTLHTGNLPILNKLINLPFGGNTPFSAEVWFINKTVKRDMKWGTPSPLQLDDPKYGISFQVRARGNWGFRIGDSRSFLSQVIGSRILGDSQEIQSYFQGEIIQRLSDKLSKFMITEQIPATQLSTRLNDLSKFVGEDIRKELERFGIEVINFNVEGVNIPKEELEQLQKIQFRRFEIDELSRGKVGQGYVTARSFDTLEKAAENVDGGAGGIVSGAMGLGIGIGAGVPLGQQIGKQMNIQPETQQINSPNDSENKLQKLKEMLESGLLTQEEYQAKYKQFTVSEENQHDPVVKLKKLKQMIDLGLLTQDEFEAKKKTILENL